MTVRIGRIYHPSHRTPDLEPIERFFREVFGRHSLSRSSLTMAGLVTQAPGYPEDYCLFTPVADLFFDSIVPEKYVWDGRQPYASVSRPYLDGYGWGVDEGMQEIWDACQANGIRLTDQWNTVVEGPQMATASFKSTPLFWTHEDDTGLRYEFYPTASIANYDHRSVPGWSIPPVKEYDPLSIIRTSHHTVLTQNMPRAKKLFIDILGGEVIDERVNTTWNTESTFIRLANDVHELAVPIDMDSPAGIAFANRAPLDTYHSIGFHVADIDKVARTLEDNNVGIIHRSDTAVVADPATAVGIPWGFYAELPYATS